MTEKSLHRAVCDYLRYQYPDVIFSTDLSGATKLSIGQAVALKSLRSGRAFPDLQIMEPRNGYHSLFIELKKEGTELFKKRIMDKNGYPLWASDHLREQHEMLEKLTKKGFKAEFAIGWDEAKKIIDNYLKK